MISGFFFSEIKNFKLPEWETSFCFSSIFKFWGFLQQYSYYHRLALVKLNILSITKPSRSISQGKKNPRNHATYPILVSPRKRGVDSKNATSKTWLFASYAESWKYSPKGLVMDHFPWVWTSGLSLPTALSISWQSLNDVPHCKTS